MPFKSDKQRKYLWATRTELARKWADEAKAEKDQPKKSPKKK